MLRKSACIVLFTFMVATAFSQNLDFEHLDLPLSNPIQRLLEAKNGFLYGTSYKSAWGLFGNILGEEYSVYSTNQGKNWHPCSRVSDESVEISHLAQLDDGRIFVIANSKLYVSTDTGQSWSLHTPQPPAVNGVLEIQNNALLVYGVDSLFLSRDGLASYENVTPPPTPYSLPIGNPIHDLAESTTGDIYMSRAADIYRSTDNGATWTSIASFYDSNEIWTPRYAHDIETNGNELILRQAYTGNVLHSTDMGATWTMLYQDYSFDPPFTVRQGYLYCKIKNDIYRRELATGNEVHLPIDQSSKVLISNSNTMFKYGEAGVAVSDDFGQTWSSRNSGLSNPSVIAVYPSHDSLFAIFDYRMKGILGTYSLVLRSPDGGSTWENLDSVTSYFDDKTGSKLFYRSTSTDGYIYILTQSDLLRINKHTGECTSVYQQGQHAWSRIFKIVYDDAANSIIFSTGKQAFSSNGTSTDFQPVSMHDSILCDVFSGSDGKTYVSTSVPGTLSWQNGYSISRYDHQQNSLRHFCNVHAQYSQGIREWMIDSKDMIVTMRTNWTDISRDLGQSWKAHRYLDGEYGQALFIDKNDIIYVGTTKRLLYSTNSGFTWEDSGFRGWVSNITMDDNRMLYLSTATGIYRTTPNLQYVVSTEELAAMPTGISLAQNYPNPVTGSTTIPFSLRDASDVTLEVYNTLGRKVATVLQSHTASGAHSIPFDAYGLAPGMYRYVLRSAGVMHSKWMTVVR